MPQANRLARTALALGLAFPLLGAEAASCSVSSPAHRVALIELYTSEGCSSCPPADRWLGELSRRFTAEQVIALSLHVDYWDYIGWKDPFAQSRFAQRQHWLSALGPGSPVYTPEVFAGMKELRGWQDKDLVESRIHAINGQPAPAQITLRMDSSGAGAARLEARFALAAPRQGGGTTQGVVIVYEKQLSSEIPAGENRGATLRHGNVVRYWSAPVVLDARSGRAEWRQSVDLPAGWKRENLGVAALIEDAKGGELLQAVAMPGCV